MDGEATYFLPPLSLPEAGASAEEIGDYESIRLFVERAKLARSTFLLTSENSHTILDICRRVDGIPLAIEFTAARVNILSVEEISEQLQKSFAILASDNRKTHSRHQTLQTSMDWSWSLLTGLEKSFLQELSVFVGGWTLEAAMAVCDGQVFDLTNALVKPKGVNNRSRVLSVFALREGHRKIKGMSVNWYDS